MRSDFKKECEELVEECKRFLTDNREWEERYSDYATGILNNHEKKMNARNLFRQVKSLYLYSCVSKAYTGGNGVEYDLRFAGQSVATLKINKNGVTINTKDKDANNKKYFTLSNGMSPNSLDDIWTSKQAQEFKVFFRDHKEELSKNVKMPEHRVENELLISLSSHTSHRNITPVKIAGAYFQMPTSFRGSDKKEVSYSGNSGGGIDILARVTHGSNADNRFAVMELKDENKSSEPQKDVLLQAIKYATFMAYLFKSKSGYNWLKILNPKTKAKSVPEQLNIDVVSVMPKGETDILEGNEEDEYILVDDNVRLHLYSLFFDSNDINNFSGTFANVIKK